jgi:hypothetical protein
MRQLYSHESYKTSFRKMKISSSLFLSFISSPELEAEWSWQVRQTLYDERRRRPIFYIWMGFEVNPVRHAHHDYLF